MVSSGTITRARRGLVASDQGVEPVPAAARAANGKHAGAGGSLSLKPYGSVTGRSGPPGRGECVQLHPSSRCQP